jgi:hypothetical protein
MKRRLSSLQTVLMKIVYPVMWIPIFDFITFRMPFDGPGGRDSLPKWVYLLGGVAGAAFIYWSCARLKAVSVDDQFLYVSNYLKEVSIPLSEIYDVTENRWINIHPVTIHLKSPSEFGDKIVFMPKSMPFAFFSSHPVVNELKKLAGSKNVAAGFMR